MKPTPDRKDFGARLGRTLGLLMVAAMTALATPPEFRLPDSVMPLACALELTIRPDQEHFQGVVEIDTQVVSQRP